MDSTQTGFLERPTSANACQRGLLLTSVSHPSFRRNQRWSAPVSAPNRHGVQEVPGSNPGAPTEKTVSFPPTLAEVPGASMGFAHGRNDDKSRRPDWHRACQVAGFRASRSFPNCPRPAPAVPVAAIYSGRRAPCPWLEAREKREARRASARQWDRKGALGHEGNAGTVCSGITP